MIRTQTSHLPVDTITHPGMTGKNNEDRFGVSSFRLEDRRATPSLLAVLSDGIGGHRAGEIASEIAVERITQMVEQSDGLQPLKSLQEAVHAASQEIFLQSQSAPERQGMGATCAVAWIIGNQLYTTTIGDSRIYLIRSGAIHQLSTDHTWIQEAIEHGVLQPDEVENHPNAHVIRRYLGSPTPPELDFRMRLNSQETDQTAEANQGMQLRVGDRLVLCSDGLTDLVKAPEILAAFASQPQKDTLQTLVDLANQRGGHDNITIIAVEVPKPSPPTVSQVSAPTVVVRTKKGSGLPRHWPYFALGCLGLAAVAAIVITLAVGWAWLIGERRQQTPTVAPPAAATLAQPTPGPATATLPAPTIPQPTPTAAQSSPTVTQAEPAELPTSEPRPRRTRPPEVVVTFTPWPTNTPGVIVK